MQRAFIPTGGEDGIRVGLARTAGRVQPVLGGILAGFGVLVLSGVDKAFEAWATAAMPQAWVQFVVRF